MQGPPENRSNAGRKCNNRNRRRRTMDEPRDPDGDTRPDEEFGGVTNEKVPEETKKCLCEPHVRTLSGMANHRIATAVATP